MRTIRILFLLLAAMLVAWGVDAQEHKLSIQSSKLAPAGDGMLSVYMNNVEEVTAVEFNLELPSGFTIDVLSVELSARAKDHTAAVRLMSDGSYKFIVMSPTNQAIDDIAGLLFTVRICAPEGVTDDVDYPMTIRNAVMSKKSGENVLENADADSLIIKDMPNLHVVSLECSEPVAGKTLTIKWKVRNDGHGSTGDSQWRDYIWLVPDISAGTSLSGTKLLASVENISALASNESYENTINVTLEERIYGNYDLLVTSNMYGASSIDFSPNGGTPPIPYSPETEAYGFLKAKAQKNSEKMEENGEYNGISDNFFYKRINIAVQPLPDIQVPHVVAVVDNSESYAGENKTPSPINNAGLASSSAFYSGKKVKVTATIENKGEADVSSTYINNALYISSAPNLDEGTNILLSTESTSLAVEAGGSVEVTLRGTIPYEWYGDTYFIVKADVNESVYELANTVNNSGVSDKLNTLLTPGADFEPYKLSAPKQISSGSPFEINYSVRNVGAGLPYVNSWVDCIYISSKNTWDESAKAIGTCVRSGRYLLVGEGYEYQGDNYAVSQTLNVTGLESGTYYLYVKVDVNDEVFEYEGEDNNIIASKELTLTTPDLTAELISISEDTLLTGDKVAVAWKVKNTGTADVTNVTLSDRFYAGSDATGDGMLSLGTVSNTVSIAAGGEKLLRANLEIPRNRDLNGLRYVYVRTNQDKAVSEENTENNLSVGIPKHFEYIADENIKVKGSNLTLSSLQASSSVEVGNSLAVNYIIKNTGSVTFKENVTQEIFLSRSSIYDQRAKACTVMGTLPDVTLLASGESVTVNAQIAIPADMQGGQYYLHVLLNREDKPAEKLADDNRLLKKLYVNGNLPNWVATDLIVPATVMTSIPTTVTWTLTNSGSWDADAVINEVYLSTDAAYSSGYDVLLAKVSSSSLAAGQSETLKATIELADDVMGTRHIIVRSDVNESSEEENEEDNLTIRSFTAKQSPLPDLKISELVTEGEWKGGQTITLKAQVENVGDSVTRSNQWTDVFYLSKSHTLDNNAIKLGSKTHVGKLEKGEGYSLLATLTIPDDLKGYYVLFAVVDGTHALIEKSTVNNQVKSTVYVEDRYDTPADLIVDKLVAPSKIMAGELVTISYTLLNKGIFTAKGKLRDVIYLSEDNVWDENDTMVGVVNGDIELEPGNALVRSVTGRITNLQEGNYHLILRTNSAHTIAESDYDNNSMVQQSTASVEFARLTLDGSANLSTSGLFKLELHSGLVGKTVGLYLTHPEESPAGIYTSFENVPSTAWYECASSSLETTQQEVLIPDVRAGSYYILAQDNAAVGRNLNEFVLDGVTDAPQTPMTISAREIPFGATSLGIAEGGADGWITTDIHGALFDSIMDFRLTLAEKTIPAEVISFADQTNTVVTFNLNEAEMGSYDVVSELPDGTKATLPAGFKVIPGQSVNLGVKLDLPSASRSFSYAPISISYANGGNTDIVIKELLVVATGAYLSETVEGLKEKKQEMHVVPDYPKDRMGNIVIPPGTQEVINCFIGASNNCTVTVYIVK